MPNETKTIEELLIELDAADTQLSNVSARAIRELKRDLYATLAVLENLKDFLDEK